MGMSIYSQLGVRRVINASATLTRLGGSLMPQEVLNAMADAASSFVDMPEYHVAAGRHLAELTQNEAAYVTAGCAAAISLSTLACIAGKDPAAIDRMPGGVGLRTQVIMQRSQRMPYDPAVRLVGAEIVEIGDAIQTFDWELESAIGPGTAAVLFVAGSHLSRGALDLETVIKIAHAHEVPVIVDAAAQLPPVSNLWRFSRDLGADLVLFSGGKELRGPQASGLIVGRADLIEACAANGAPNQRLVRAMKVGKEEIAGLLKAVELYVQQDHDAELARREGICASWITDLSSMSGISARRTWPGEAGQPTPRVLIEIEPDSPTTGRELEDRLWEGDPRIAVAAGGETGFYITPEFLADDEVQMVVDRIGALLTVTKP